MTSTVTIYMTCTVQDSLPVWLLLNYSHCDLAFAPMFVQQLDSCVKELSDVRVTLTAVASGVDFGTHDSRRCTNLGTALRRPA